MTVGLPSVALAALVAASVVLPVADAAGQPASTSTTTTKELVALLEKKVDASMAFVAAKMPDKPGYYVGALYLQSVPQLLVVVAEYDPAVLMDERLAKRDYREAYTDLNSASKAGTRTFFEDLKADGLFPRREGSDPFDMITAADGRRIQFDSDWKKQKMTEDEYDAAFTAADKMYAAAVQGLLAAAKKGS
jgi:hypothetical protein